MIELFELSASFDDNEVLHGVSLCAKRGEVTAIVGANGSGKTTLLKCIAGIRSYGGRIVLDGVDKKEMDREDVADMLSYMDQSTESDADLNVFEVVLLGKARGLSFSITDEDIDSVYDVLDLLDIRKFAGRRIDELSGGQRQLVFLAQALIKSPSILLMDEPTSALDVYRQFKIMEFIKKMTVERDYTTVVVLHHLDMALRYADSVAVLDNGHIYDIGAPNKVFTKEMFANVYHVDAELIEDKDGVMHILTIGPIDDSEPHDITIRI